MTLRKPAALIVALSLLTAGCAAAASDKSGGTGPKQVLVLASNDGAPVSAPAVTRFVDRVSELSGGRVQVTISSNWGGGGDEARTIRDVASGKAVLGWSGTRAFDTVGVRSFEPLHAPFLISSYAAQAAVVKDPVASDMLAALRPLGLTGLALAGDELRMAAAASKPLLTPSDFQDVRFGTIASTVQTRGLAALGAEPVTIQFPRPPDTDGLGGVETMWRTYAGQHQYEFMPFVTGNAVLWPRTVAIFASTKALDGLDRTTRGWLVQAAADAQAWSTEHAADLVPSQLTEPCSNGLRIATATPDQLKALRAAAEPVYTSLRADPALARSLDRIQGLVASAKPDPAPTVPDTCIYHPGDETGRPEPVPVLTAAGRTGTLPEGRYRFAFSVDDLVAGGLSQSDAENNAGVGDWTIRAGQWRWVSKPALVNVPHYPSNPLCEGWYDVRGHTVRFTTTTRYTDGDCAPPTWSARWTIKGGTLTWTAVNPPGFGTFWALKPWQRVR